jgi:hypothetical protein
MWSYFVEFLFMELTKIVPIVIGVYFFKQLPAPYRLVLYHLFLVSICEITGYYLTVTTDKTNSWVFNFLWLLPELLLMGIAGRGLIQAKSMKNVATILMLIGIVIWIVNIYKTGINQFANWTFIYISIMLIVIYLNVLFNSIFNGTNLVRSPAFWLSVSVILYFSCALPYFGLFQYLNTTSRSLAKGLFYINEILILIRYPMVAVSFYLLGKQGLPAKQKLST